MNAKTIAYIFILILLLISVFFSLNLFFQQRSAHDKLDIGKFPYEIGEWTGRDIKVEEYEYKILETRNLIVREYENPSHQRIGLFIVYSETNRSVFHPPEVCFIGSGVEIVNKDTEPVNFGQRQFLTNKLYIEKAGRRDIVLYSYKAGHLYTDNFYLQQAYFALSQLLGKRIKGATIRVSMPVIGDEEQELATLKSFLAEASKIMDEL